MEVYTLITLMTEPTCARAHTHILQTQTHTQVRLVSRADITHLAGFESLTLVHGYQTQT